jgi:O-antigen ligase
LPLLPENNININKIITIFMIFAILSNLIIVIYQSISGFYVTGLFLATNAFGGFMMIVSSFAFSNFFYSSKNTFNLIILGLAVMLLLMSYSRGSILAIAAAIICVFFKRRGNFFITRFALFFLVCTQAIILYFTYPVYESSPFDAYAFAVSGVNDAKVSNIFIRVYENWPRGLHMFLHSPIFGTGFGSANDLPHILDQNSYMQFNQNNIRIYNSAHAHHTFLHVMGEMGIIGLIILIMLLKSIYHEIIQTGYNMPVSAGLEIAFFALIFASFTEHRLFSPSNVFPFILIFLLNYKNFNRAHKNEK